MIYQAYFRNGNGKVLGKVFAEDDREAARKLFAQYPKCQAATVCNAYRDEAGKLRSNGNNMHWFNRRDLSA